VVVIPTDDVGKITRRKVPFVRPVAWDTWDQDAPSVTYESLGLAMRTSIFPGQT